MPENPSEQPPDQTLSARELFEQVWNGMKRDQASQGSAVPNGAATEAIVQGIPPGRIEQGKLRDIQVEFVRNPDRGPDFDMRHNMLLITQQVIEALLSGDEEHFEYMRDEIARKGGFFMRYNGEGRQRLQEVFDPQNPKKGGWLMAETRGIPLSRDGVPLTQSRVLGSDGQFYIPPDDDSATTEHFPLLGEKDPHLDAPMLTEEIKTHPQVAMLIADISAVPEYMGHGFAAATEDAAFNRIRFDINTTRDHVIKYALAAIASVKGVMDKNGLLLAPQQEPEGWRNYRSLFLHTSRHGATGYVHGKQLRRMIPVELPAGDPGQLLVDWYITAQQIQNAKQRPDIHYFDEEYPS